MKKFIIATLLLLGFIPSVLTAQELAPVKPPPKVPYVQSVADDLDDFLSGNDEIVTGPNDTRLIIGQRLIWNEGGEWDYKPYADLKLHLPKFAEKWRLRFTTYDTDEEEVGLSTTRVNTQQREEDVGLAIFFLSRFENIQMTYQHQFCYTGWL